MDLGMYYKSIRDLEESFATPYAVVVSRVTGDGGKSGVTVEVTRHVAAKMVIEGTAELASAEVAAAFQKAQVEAHEVALEAARLGKVAVTMVSSDDLKKLTEDMKMLKSGFQGGKE